MPVFRVLGPLEIRDAAGRPIPVARRKQRALLALLVTRAGRAVPVDEIVDALWGERPPASARANLHTYVSDLRRLLPGTGPAAIPRPATTPAGYRLDLAVDECDALLFGSLLAEARRLAGAGSPDEAAARFTRALGLWRGPVLSDLGAYAWVAPFAARLEETRLAALEDLVDARLLLGQHADLAVELAATTAGHPLRERLWRQYLLALHRAGRRTDALRAYRRLRVALATELGVEPDRSLRDLYREVAADSTATPAPVGPTRAGDGAPPRSSRQPPALLPSDVADFTGRDGQVRRLQALLGGDAAAAAPPALPVAGITGMAGVGKTTLAVHVAHRVAPSYPDGQLYVNLRAAGASADGAADVLGRFLRALGVDARAVPDDPEERAETYRHLLAGRRVLVVLDNAATARQVRPLLPGSASCGVVLTSRSRLTDLEGVRWLDLDVLPPAEAYRLLERVVDDHRVGEQPDDAAQVVRLCGGLPLAVRIAGARLGARPGWPLAHMVELLRDERRRLGQLATGDLAVRASLALSYDGVDASARRLLRVLALFDVPDLPAWLAGAAAGGPPGEALQALEALVDAHLLTVAGTDPAGQERYRFHDLVRIFARDRADAEDPPRERAEALRRGLGGFLAVAERMADRVPGPCYARIGGAAPRPPLDPGHHGLARTDPLTWFDAERATLLAAVRQACGSGLDELAFDLAGCLEKYFDVRGMYADWADLNRRVLATCRAAGNLRGEAVMLRGLIDVTTWAAGDGTPGAMTRSLDEATRLLAMFERLGERRGMSDAEVMRAWALTAAGEHDRAVDAATRALRWARESGHVGGRARAHVALAVVCGERREIGAAVDHLHEALAAARELGNDRYEATVLQFLGIAYRECGDLDLGEKLLGESLAVSRRYRDRYPEVLSLIALARLYLRRGDPRARATAETALALAREYRMAHHVADALGALGEIELAAGRSAEAVEYLRESVAVWRTRGWLSFLAAALTTLGRAMTDLDPAGAQEASAEARDLYNRLRLTHRV